MFKKSKVKSLSALQFSVSHLSQSHCVLVSRSQCLRVSVSQCHGVSDCLSSTVYLCHRVSEFLDFILSFSTLCPWLIIIQNESLVKYPKVQRAAHTWKTRLTPTRAFTAAAAAARLWRWWWATIFYGDLSTHSRFAMAFDPGVSDFL